MRASILTSTVTIHNSIYLIGELGKYLPGTNVPFMISQKAQYALRALIALARAEPGEVSLISDIAEAQRIPKKFLEQILLDLKHHGIVQSRRGKMGGYLLLKPAEKITFGEILRIIDGPLAPLPCLSKIAYRRCEGCVDEATCEIRGVFAQVAEATRGVLDTVTIAEAISDPDRIAIQRRA
jgi:Rrf2 family protein